MRKSHGAAKITGIRNAKKRSTQEEDKHGRHERGNGTPQQRALLLYYPLQGAARLPRWRHRWRPPALKQNWKGGWGSKKGMQRAESPQRGCAAEVRFPPWAFVLCGASGAALISAQAWCWLFAGERGRGASVVRVWRGRKP
eukprot:gene25292-biopygen23974